MLAFLVLFSNLWADGPPLLWSSAKPGQYMLAQVGQSCLRIQVGDARFFLCRVEPGETDLELISMSALIDKVEDGHTKRYRITYE